MTENVRNFIREQAEKLELSGPVVEFGAMQVPGQEGFADIRPFFPGLEFVGCDMRPGTGVDVIDDMEQSHFAPSSIGTVVSLETLEHVRHPWIAIQEAYRILEPGGTLILSVPFRHHIHDYPDDYWRMTASGLEILMRQAGFEEIDTWDDDAELIETMRYPFHAFGVARKPESARHPVPLDSCHSVEKADFYRASILTRERTSVKGSKPREAVPVIVPLFGREPEARMMFEQLDRVTDNYSLILIDNGFEDAALLDELKPAGYVKNDENTGVVRAMNQGLDLCVDAPIIVAMHSDTVIYDEGWLDHIIDFLESRPDVGLIGLVGRHSIREDGSLDLETTVLKQQKHFPRSMRPTWRFSEVAAIDGMAFVMRNLGLRLDESLGLMHYYDLDISMQYIEAGYRVYTAGVDCWHMAGFGAESSRASEPYLAAVGGDDEVYYDEVREKFRRKWQHMLPITRGFRDEAYAHERITELLDRSEEMENLYRKVDVMLKRAEVEVERRGDEIGRAAEHIEKVESHLEAMTKTANSLQAQLEAAQAAVAAGACGEKPPGRIERFRHSLATEGVSSTAKRTVSKVMNKLRKR
ncbi:MAG: glycosyltransferase [Candidatus Geothermincolia bacterium]